MFASRRCGHYVKFVEPDNLIDWSRTGDICSRPDVIESDRVVVNGPCIVDRRPRPRAVERFFTCHKRHMPTRILTFLDKLAALVITRDNDYMLCHKVILQIQFPPPVLKRRFYFEVKECHNLSVETMKMLVAGAEKAVSSEK